MKKLKANNPGGLYGYLPQRLRKVYMEIQASEVPLTSCQREIELLEVRFIELVKRIDKGGIGRIWNRLRAAWRMLQSAKRLEDPARKAMQMQQALNAIGTQIERGYREKELWREIGNVIDAKGKLKSIEHKRLSDLQQTLSVKQFMQLMQVLGFIVRKHVQDKEAATRISEELHELLSPQGALTVDAGS